MDKESCSNPSVTAEVCSYSASYQAEQSSSHVLLLHSTKHHLIVTPAHYVGLKVTIHEDHKTNMSIPKLPLRGLRTLDQCVEFLLSVLWVSWHQVKEFF